MSEGVVTVCVCVWVCVCGCVCVCVCVWVGESDCLWVCIGLLFMRITFLGNIFGPNSCSL